MDSPFHYALQSLLINTPGSRAAKRNLESHREKKGLLCWVPRPEGLQGPNPTPVAAVAAAGVFFPAQAPQRPSFSAKTQNKYQKETWKSKDIFKMFKDTKC